jgi:lambda repressor-like predicted transcriptional regulator
MIQAQAHKIAGEADARGWSMMRLADELGVSLNTAKALLDGKPVGGKTIAAALEVFHPLGFDDLFIANGEEAPAPSEVAA